mmetsp:Transcript_616/g.1760  ORF Transcript_616/g.1760 Transcript_616/m.1760 type:complete len:136 (+) Transcript_616:1065-1472(+)
MTIVIVFFEDYGLPPRPHLVRPGGVRVPRTMPSSAASGAAWRLKCLVAARKGFLADIYTHTHKAGVVCFSDGPLHKDLRHIHHKDLRHSAESVEDRKSILAHMGRQKDDVAAVNDSVRSTCFRAAHPRGAGVVQF